jgi:hypothetical protein
MTPNNTESIDKILKTVSESNNVTVGGGCLSLRGVSGRSETCPYEVRTEGSHTVKALPSPRFEILRVLVSLWCGK